MKNKKAVEILQKQQSFLNSQNHNHLDELWLIQTEYYFKKFFKEDSWQVKIISTIQFPSIQHENYNVLYESTRMKLNNLLSNSIEVINDVGIEIPYKNLFSRLDNTWLIAIVSAITITSFNAGIWFDSHTFSKPTTVVKPVVVAFRANPHNKPSDTSHNKAWQNIVGNKVK